MIRIYFNSACSKCQDAYCALEHAAIEFETVHYLDQIPDKETLRRILKKLQIPALEMMRTNEPLFVEKFGNIELSEADCIDAMHQYPSLIQRPIVEWADKALIVRPPNTIEGLLEKLRSK